MIKLRNIYKAYGSNEIVKDLNLDIPSGKLVTLLGPNGVGKSTLLRIIAGSERADSGEVSYRNHQLSEFCFPFVGEIGFVHETLNYVTPFSIKDFVDRFKINVKNWDQKYFNYLTKARGIDLSGLFQSYSRGQKMQIALMINLAMKPKVLLLDEITSVIDVYGRKFFLDELKKFVQDDGTAVITTNIINELEFYTDHLLILKDKKIQVNQSISELNRDFIKLRKKFEEDHPIFQEENCIWAGANSDQSVSYIVEKELFEKYNEPIQFIDKRQSTLEDIFIHFFSQKDDRNE